MRTRPPVPRPEPPGPAPRRRPGAPRPRARRPPPAPGPARQEGYGTAPTLDRGPKARACILVWLAGGPSHIDTWDPKPDAPADVRGEFQPIETSVPGRPDQRGPPRAGEGPGPGHPDPEHDLARGRPRPRHPPPADRLPAEPGAGLSELRQRRREGPRLHRRARCRRTRRCPSAPAFASQRLPDPRLRPVRRRRRPEPGGLPGPRPDPARSPDPRPAPTAGGRWSRRSTTSPAPTSPTPR